MSARSREKAYGTPEKVTRFALRCPESLWETLCDKADQHGRSRNSEVLAALKAHAKRKS